MKKIYLLLLPALSMSFLHGQICNPCGDGSDGAMVFSSDGTLPGGSYDYTSFTINAGVTVLVTGTQPLEIRCSGNVVINGTLNASGGNGMNGITYTSGGTGGIGVAGGQNGGAGTFASGSGPLNGVSGSGAGAGSYGAGWSGGGGAGYGASGSGSGGVGGSGGPVYGDAQLSTMLGGSGGGGGSGGYDCGAGGGGAGGGYISITACGSITIGATGSIRVNGGNGGSDGTGNCGGGGGGSGGSLWLAASSIINNGSLQAMGGAPGASNVPGSPYFGTGGAGASGRIRLDGLVSGSGTVNPAAGYSGTFSPGTVSISSASVTPNDTICLGEQVTLSATASGGTGPYTYNWMPGNLGGNPTLTPSASDTYTVTATETGGCTASATVTITVNSLPSVTVTGPASICQGDTATLTGTSGGTSQWYMNGVLIPGATSNTYQTTAAGSYNMTKTNLNGCTDSAAAGLVLTVNALPAVLLDLTTDTFCINYAPVTLGGSPSGGVYSGPGVSGTSFSPSTAGIGAHDLVYNYTDGNACSNSDTVSVTVLGCAGTDEQNNTTLQVYPNPTEGQLYISGLTGESVQLQLTDMSGRIVLRMDIQHPGEKTLLPLDAFAPGTYMLRMDWEAHTAHYPVVIR